ncbi:MAG: HEPN domain-containing protein [Deltaproteobacteria bacterium]|nr:HEPN domain-containing protein [Deltaproteobacteria bacterium]
MTNISLAKNYLIKADKRLKVLDLLLEEEAYSDVIREAQECVELALKGMLRFVGIDPLKWYDVGGILVEYKEKFPLNIRRRLNKAAKISKWLRKERELSFYGDIDFIPTEEYTKKDALRAIYGANFCVEIAKETIIE